MCTNSINKKTSPNPLVSCFGNKNFEVNVLTSLFQKPWAKKCQDKEKPTFKSIF